MRLAVPMMVWMGCATPWGKLPLDTGKDTAWASETSSAPGPGDDCTDGGIYDCNGECWVTAARDYLGDGICDAGDRGPNFDCSQTGYDGGDCASGAEEGGTEDGGLTGGGLTGIGTAGATDAGSTDASATDGGSTDASTTDAGGTDSGSSDPSGTSGVGGGTGGAMGDATGWGGMDDGSTDGSTDWGGSEGGTTSASTDWGGTDGGSTGSSTGSGGSTGTGGSTSDECPYSYAVGDGWCDGYANIPECDFDGGDCCESTCVDSTYTCGVSSDYDCLDPDAPPPPPPEIGGACVVGSSGGAGVYDCDLTCVSAFSGSGPYGLGNGACDTGAAGDDANLNCEHFEYDEGDCCETTCEPDSLSDCEEFDACIDPTAGSPEIGGTCFGYSFRVFTGEYDCNLHCVESVGWSAPGRGDGTCDSESGDSDEADYNCSAFDYDGGDCCAGSCVPYSSFDCEDFDACDDPSELAAAPGGDCRHYDWSGDVAGVLDCDLQCIDASDAETDDPGTWAIEGLRGDGDCDGEYSWDTVDLNCAAFGYDGGDCSTVAVSEPSAPLWGLDVDFPESSIALYE